MQFQSSPTRRGLLSLCSILLLATGLAAEEGPGQFQVLPELSGFTSSPPDLDLEVTARIRMAENERVGMLEVTATMNPSWHVYSITQPPGGPMKTTIELEPSEEYRLLGSFAPDRPAHVHFDDDFDMDVEEHQDEITWLVPIALSDLVTPSSLVIKGHVRGQACSIVCITFGEKETRFSAKVSGTLSPSISSALVGTRLPNTHGSIRGWLSNTKASPGGTVLLNVAFDPDEDWHVYGYAQVPPSLFQKPTLIETRLPDGWETGTVSTSAAIVSTPSPVPSDPPTQYYEGAVTWSLPIRIPESVPPDTFPLEGHVAFQTCAATCDPPTATAWQSKLQVMPPGITDASSHLAAVRFSARPSAYDAVVDRLTSKGSSGPASPGPGPGASQGFDPSKVKIQPRSQNFAWILVLAFLGGFVLNFMPCVLPVIGLKIMSFVDQAGQSRGRVFALNLWYALGMLSIFWVLATLAAAPALGLRDQTFGWGQQFNHDEFNIPLTCVVFVMGLSFLGVWEIPIPGFATSHKANQLLQKEGVSGAFSKGVITTILATPCSAPALAAAYAWAVSSMSPTLTYLVFTVMGLGMALPYLVLGAFPRLVRFLPKPGAWMETFKQLMGFVLLGTVVFLITFIEWTNIVPTITLLFGLWFACWWIGRVPLTAELDRRLRAWAMAFGVGVVVATVAFANRLDAFERTFYGVRGAMVHRFNETVNYEARKRGLQTATVSHSKNELPWEPFSDQRLKELTSNGETVMVDFTADW